jgi:hypothetical protein
MPFCGHCKNLGKEYTSHFPHKTQSKNSPLTCPELLKNVCTNCSSRNHTLDKCNKKTIPVVQTPVKKSNTSKYNILLECPICQCIECYCDNNYLETKIIARPRNYGEELYAIVAKDYPLCAGKMTGMFLELDRTEIEEMLENPALMKERIDEASELLDAKHPWGHVDAIFRPPCVHSRSSACEPNLEEVKKMDVREEYRARVYATNPFWDVTTIDKIVEHFMMQALSPEEIYKLFVNFEEFKKQANLVVAGVIVDEDYEEFSLSDRYEDEDDDEEPSLDWVIKSLDIIKEM